VHAAGEDGLQRVDTDFTDLDQRLTKRLAVCFPNAFGHGVHTGPEGPHGSFQAPGCGLSLDLCQGHGVSLHERCDSCLS
jgi:hypothetical protein